MRRIAIAKGLGIAGALLLSACGRETALHDTYYVVSHVQYALQILTTLIVIVLLWRWMRPRLAHGWRHIHRASIIAILAGAVLALLPTIDFATGQTLETIVSRIHILNTLSMIGGLLIMLASLSTLIALVMLCFTHLRQR